MCGTGDDRPYGERWQHEQVIPRVVAYLDCLPAGKAPSERRYQDWAAQDTERTPSYSVLQRFGGWSAALRVAQEARRGPQN